MSTFDGIITEFPTIRVDNFRYHPDRAPPQACFLSHVHSDHLQGLETLKMPFVYCSAATKNILLRMEKYPHRMNFARGILEVRKQTYRSLKLVLRELPLESPVEIELDPKTKIRVTLFDANHCPGAVMFLFEGPERAALYTGDVRAEPWWVNTLICKPILLPYACGAKRLDCVYLDTTFASRDRIYEEFPTKADGLKELLGKVAKCPKDSRFYVRSWTLGYEDVWIALSNFLRSPIHVDAYQLRIFRSLTTDVQQVDRGPALAGFPFGNQYQFGCLTDDARASIHSCEPGTECHDRLKTEANVIWIFPIVSRTKEGIELAEIGAGGGGGDLYQTGLLEMMDEPSSRILEELYSASDRYKYALAQLRRAFETARACGALGISIKGLGLDQEEEVSIKEFINIISRQIADGTLGEPSEPPPQRVIHFPYSRHSSFSELRHLISAFRPKDICPCTVDIDTWSNSISMKSLFGDLCSESLFQHDQQIALTVKAREETGGKKRKRKSTRDERTIVDDDDDGKQKSPDQASESTEQTYTSAKTSSPRRTPPAEEGVQEGPGQKQQRRYEEAKASEQQMTPSSFPSTDLPTPIRRFHRALSNRFERELQSQQLHERDHNCTPDGGSSVDRPMTTTTTTTTQTDASTGTGNDKVTGESAWETSVHPALSPYSPITGDQDQDRDRLDNHEADDSTASLPTMTSHSQARHSSEIMISPLDAVDDDDDDDDETGWSRLRKARAQRLARLASRAAGYRAARVALRDNIIDDWRDLNLRSVGWKGHSEEEREL